MDVSTPSTQCSSCRDKIVKGVLKARVTKRYECSELIDDDRKELWASILSTKDPVPLKAEYCRVLAEEAAAAASKSSGGRLLALPSRAERLLGAAKAASLASKDQDVTNTNSDTNASASARQPRAKRARAEASSEGFAAASKNNNDSSSDEEPVASKAWADGGA
eukprot:gene10113-21558_t